MKTLGKETYINRRKSQLVKMLMKASGKKPREMAEALGCSLAYFNNKLFRNSFKFEDLVLLANEAGYELVFRKKQDNTQIDLYLEL